MLSIRAGKIKGSLSNSEFPEYIVGSPITPEQAEIIREHMNKGIQTFGEDMYMNALYVQQKMVESFGQVWNVEIIEEEATWGRATHIFDQTWIIFFKFGASKWNYFIWVPEC